jgi:hypothetical protein
MSTRTGQRPVKTAEERAAKVEALTDQLHGAVERLANSDQWRAMLQVAAKFHRYSFNNQIALWVQAEARGLILTRVAGFHRWRELGYCVRHGEKGLKILAPIKRRLRPDEVAEWKSQGKDPFDAAGLPRIVVRGFRIEHVFDQSQVDLLLDAEPLPERSAWIVQEGNGPAGLWDRICVDISAAGFTLEHRPSISSDGQAHGWVDYTRRIIWINSACEVAEQLRIAAHEWFGHVKSDHEHREISRAQKETEADSVAFVVLAALGFDISSSSVEYVTGWSDGDGETLREAAETVRRVAVAVLGELDNGHHESLGLR